ncbi:MAG: hypothetical protein OEY14_18670 [Myxococcales bacterium]|nr:hypothetical protein [Myxococcales bacterium]
MAQRDEADRGATERGEGGPEADESGEGRPAKKERVLHTRVPAVLEQELKRLARNLRVPVSNVVRAILEDAVDAVDDIGRRAEGELRGVAERLASERERLRRRAHEGSHPPAEAAPAPAEAAPPPAEAAPAPAEAAPAPAEAAPPPAEASDPLAGAVGFSPIVLVSATECGVKRRALEAGEEAFLVHFLEPGRPKIVVCRDALPVGVARPSESREP